MKQKDVLTKNDDLLNVMFRGTPFSCVVLLNPLNPYSSILVGGFD